MQAAGYLGLTNPKGPFAVEIGSAKKFGFLDSPGNHPTELARRILRPKSPEDQLDAYRAAVLQAPDIAEVYKHYRGENIPQDTFLKNALVDTFGIPEACNPLCAIENAGVHAVRAHAEIFGTGKIIDQIRRGINNAKVLSRNSPVATSMSSANRSSRTRSKNPTSSSHPTSRTCPSISSTFA